MRGEPASEAFDSRLTWYCALMGDELAGLDATAQAQLVRRGELQPIDLVEAAIARIERIDSKINGVTIRLFEKARTQARSTSLPAGPFRGVPLLLKDYFCHTADDPYYAGTRFLKDLDWHEQHDTYLAGKLRTAGFVFIGKTNLPDRLQLLMRPRVADRACAAVRHRLPGQYLPAHYSAPSPKGLDLFRKRGDALADCVTNWVNDPIRKDKLHETGKLWCQ
jgi:amidase